MTDINRIVITGRLTKDCNLKYFNNGGCIGNFSIAVNRNMKKDGQWIDTVSYFDCKIFGHTAENLTPYLVKGKQVVIDGYLKQDSWKDDTGKSHSNVNIMVDDLQFVGGGAKEKAPAMDDASYGYGQ